MKCMSVRCVARCFGQREKRTQRKRRLRGGEDLQRFEPPALREISAAALAPLPRHPSYPCMQQTNTHREEEKKKTEEEKERYYAPIRLPSDLGKDARVNTHIYISIYHQVARLKARKMTEKNTPICYEPVCTKRSVGRGISANRRRVLIG